MEPESNLPRTAQPTAAGDVAIIGMACMFPGAPNLDAYWQNIVNKVDAITDPPPEAWDAELFYDPASNGNDRVYCKRGGYLGPLAVFNPLDYGIMPVGLEGGEPDQWLALKVAHDALADASYLERLKENPEERHRTAIILGKGTYLNRGNLNMVQHSLVVDQTLQALLTLHPEYTEDDLLLIRQELKQRLPPFNVETAPGLVPNIVVGRIANRLDLMGPAYTVDAACASSLIAIEVGLRELLTGQCDLALVGGAQVTTPIPILALFSRLNALSRRQEIRPFDKDADGTILGEGIGIIVLKRREDAERDGDRIYAFVKGVGSASDGRGMGVLTPRVEGEQLALRRAYQTAGVAPETVELIEAHGTGTPVGDAAEIQALQELFARRPDRLPHCALGSVKSMIGHTMPAAGIAGVVKTTLALYHKVLPPTLHCDDPNPKLEIEKTACYLNSEARPWIHGAAAAPRRAGVNAFGFGGINAHVILEENPNLDEAVTPSHLRCWESEVIVLEATSRGQLVERTERLRAHLEANPHTDLLDLAYTLNTALSSLPYRLAVVAHSLDDLQKKLARALRRLADPACRQIKDVKGIYFFEAPLYPEGKLAFLFPGEGSQYPNMLADLCLHFPEVRACFDRIDRIFVGHPRNYLPSDFIFPRPTFGGRSEVESHLWQEDGAIEAVLTANQALFTLLSRLGLRPDALVGHSTGEYSAMRAAGAILLDDETFVREHVLDLNRIYGEQAANALDAPRAILLAVGASLERVSAILEQVQGTIYVGMDNCPHQTVLVGEAAAVETAAELMRRQGLLSETLPFDRAYHTPLFTAYSQALHRFFDRLPLAPPQTRLYSCTTASLYPGEVDAMRTLAIEHWIKPVRFRETIQAMHADGARLFVEVGPRGNLTAFVEDILRGQPHQAISANLQHRSGLSQFNHLLGMLSAQGVPVRFDTLYQRRRPRKLSLESTENAAARPQKPDGRLKLATGWAGMTISPEVAAQLRERVSQRSAATRGASTTVPTTPAGPVVPTLPRPAEAAPASPTRKRSSSSNDHIEQGRPEPSSPLLNASASTAVMQAHFQLMEQFLEAQQAIMQQFLAKSTGHGEALSSPLPAEALPGMAGERQVAPPEPEPEPAPGSNPTMSRAASGERRPEAMPFLRAIRSLKPGQELVAACTLDLAEDLFLKDHTLGRAISVEDGTLLALPIVPLTISMEIMAEAAARLLPDRVLIGMRNLRAHRWILLEEETIALQIVAQRKPPPEDQEVEVYVREAADEAQARFKTPIVEGTMVFGSTYPEPPQPEPFVLRAERPSRWSPSQLYAEGMFHGPTLRAVASMDRSGEDGALATLQALPERHFFRSTTEPAFVAEPIVLDAAGQVVGFWAMENLETGFIVFPFRCAALHFFGPPLKPREQVKCQARIQLLEGGQVRSHIAMFGPDGRLRLLLADWEDKRFDLPRRFYRFLLAPSEATLSEAWAAPLNGWRGSPALQCCRVAGFPEGFFEAHGEFWEKVLAHLVLNRAERAAWRRLKGPHRRRIDWLLGRVAAKDAVRLFVKGVYGQTLAPADVEIVTDERGRPSARGDWLKQLDQPLMISVTHTDGVAVAVAGSTGADGHVHGLGIDVERVSRPGQSFEDVALTPAERALLAAVEKSEDEAWPLRLWCAKEAVGKALGQGLAGGPLSLVAKEINAQAGVIRLGLAGEMARRFPEINGALITACTLREGDLVIASVFR